MPSVKDGPKELNNLLETVYDNCVNSGGKESKCSSVAWGAAKNAGWQKDKDGQWSKNKPEEKMIKQFFNLEKYDAKTNIAEGYASTEAIDSQDQIITKDAMKNAWEKYIKFGNIREMHQPSAVGVVKESSFDDTGVFIKVKVVDPVAQKKCAEGVYKGFSVGGEVISIDTSEEAVKVAKNGIVKEMSLVEISLVDRPANPEAVFEIYKMQKTEVKKGFSDFMESQETAKEANTLVWAYMDYVNCLFYDKEKDLPTKMAELKQSTAEFEAKLNEFVVEEASETPAEEIVEESAKAILGETLSKLIKSARIMLNPSVAKQLKDVKMLKEINLPGGIIIKAEEAPKEEKADEAKKEMDTEAQAKLGEMIASAKGLMDEGKAEEAAALIVQIAEALKQMEPPKEATEENPEDKKGDEPVKEEPKPEEKKEEKVQTNYETDEKTIADAGKEKAAQTKDLAKVSDTVSKVHDMLTDVTKRLERLEKQPEEPKVYRTTAKGEILGNQSYGALNQGDQLSMLKGQLAATANAFEKEALGKAIAEIEIKLNRK